MSVVYESILTFWDYLTFFLRKAQSILSHLCVYLRDDLDGEEGATSLPLGM